MIKNKRHILSVLVLLLFMVLVTGCGQEELDTLANGTLRLSIGQASQKVETRATPAQLGKPVVENFKLRVQRSGSDVIFYDGQFVEELEIRVGTCDITAYYGENVVVGKDAPYYEGVATAEIEKDQSTSVTIPCRVANALVSVVFGRDEEEKLRFDKFYTDYGLIVKNGDYSLIITKDEVESSIYFPAGTDPTLIFYGTLKEENDKLVWCELASESLPAVFEAADHAIVTLSLPAPESALNVDIAKVEVVTESMVETIPLSWLPISTATAQHHYDSQGILMGTDVIFSNSYPGMQWKAVVTNAKGEELRTVSGTGELKSTYDSSSGWPYLPSGDYKATFYLEDEGTFNKVGSRDFSVGKPELKLLLGGYSSYTKYLEGDIDAANGCDRKTIYDISVMFNVSEALLAIFPYTFTFQYASKAVEKVATGKNTFKMSAPLTNQAVSLTPYRLKADASFDGVSVNNYKDFHITGLPVTYAPPKKETGWVAGTDYVTFSDNEVKLGNRGSLQAHYNESINNLDFAILHNTVVALDYNFMIHPATEGTTLTISVGEDVILSIREEGGLANSSDYPHKGTNNVTLSSNAVEVKCLNSYGGSKTYTSIYSLAFKYSK